MKTSDMRHELTELGGGAHVLAIQILGNVDDAADAVQDALTVALSRPGSYDAAKGPLKPWFLRIVRNRCIDLLRRRRVTDNTVDDIADHRATPERSVEIDERDRNLRQALATLDDGQRQIIVLRDYMDLTYAQIADVLDVAPGTVMSRLHRARLALANEYRKYDD